MEIIIQKFCYCCNQQHLKLFETYLLNKHFALPSQLIKGIREYPKEAKDFYCKQIYGNTKPETLKKFNQLSYHTLKLFSFIIQNFPSFLSYQLNKIEWYIFNNEISNALEGFKITKEVALKIEDYQTLIHLHHLSEKLSFSLSKSIALKEVELSRYVEFQTNIEQILLKQNSIISNITLHKKDPTTKELNYFKAFFKSKSNSVNIIAKQSYLNVLSTSNSSSFYKKENLALIQSTIKLVENNSYLLIMQHREKIMNLDYMLLKHTLYTFDDKKVDQYNSKIISKWSHLRIDNSRLEMGLLFALSIKGSYYATHLYYNTITEKTRKEIQAIITMCDDLFKTVNWENEGYLKYINFCNIYAIYLVLNHQEKEAIKIIEKVLHEFQQKQFKKLIDQLFVVLIMAYFQAKDNDKTIDTFNRYKKQTNSSVSILENDLIIYAIYYITQIKQTNRKQYRLKLNDIIAKLKIDIKLKDNLALVNRIQSNF